MLNTVDSQHDAAARGGDAEPVGCAVFLIDDPLLKKLWQRTSPLLGAERLAAERPSVAADSRGIVINGKFDLLLDGLLHRAAASGA